MEQTDRSQRVGVGGDGKRFAREHICIYAMCMDTANNLVKARGEVGWLERGKWGHL